MQIDRLSVLSLKYDSTWFLNNPVVDIVEFYINGRDLLKIIEESVGVKNIDISEYVGIDPINVFLPSENLLGKPDQSDTGMTVLYRCAGCGDGGCASIEVRITIGEDVVVWDHFRANGLGIDIDDENEVRRLLRVPEFRFPRADYMNALRYHKSKIVPGEVKQTCI